MRPIERIDNFLNLVDWIKLIVQRWGLSEEIHDSIYYDYLHNLKVLEQIVIPYWKSNPEQRIGQALINLGLISDNLLIWNDEESDILLDQDIAPEDYLYWTSIYDKDNNLLDEPVSKLLKDLTTDHIVNIYKYTYIENKRTLSELYNIAFNNILVKRKEWEALTVIQHILDALNTINTK